MFTLTVRDAGSRARAGRIATPHGDIETPAYVVVGTNAAVRCLEPADYRPAGIEAIIANTYHLWRELGDEGLANYPGLHRVMEWDGPLMTDSGGFQVFSFGAAREHGASKVRATAGSAFHSGPSTVRVTESGVYFTVEGEEEYLDAELSMKIQEQLGADIVFAFDEPSSPEHDHAYTAQAVARTHRWAERSLEALVSAQSLYGIVQGGPFEDLRRESARFIGGLPFHGFAIGGSFSDSFGDSRAQTARELEWSIPFLPEERPRHLLGIGRLEDVFVAVDAGIDTMDCVIPTREARHGSLWTARGRYDVTRGAHAGAEEPLESGCACPACAGGMTRAELYRLFKARDPEAGRLATLHNVFFFNGLMAQIRDAIAADRFAEFKKEFLGRLRSPHRT